MATKNLSGSFASSSTRGMSELDKEVETRMKRLDVFTNDFSPPGTSQAFPGGDFNKRSAPYEKPHDDFAPEAESKFWDKSKLHAAGDPKEQEQLDYLDKMQHLLDAPIKKEQDQFPGAVDMEDHKEIAKFDPHLTDPARLKKMADEKKIDGPESFHKEVEKRMKKLAGGEVVENPKPTKEPKYESGKNKDQEQ